MSLPVSVRYVLEHVEVDTVLVDDRRLLGPLFNSPMPKPAMRRSLHRVKRKKDGMP